MALIPPWVYLAGGGAIATIAFISGVSVTRMIYKAGQVDTLKAEIQVMQKTITAKDDLLADSRGVNADTQEIMSRITDALVDVTARQPKHTERITETFKDAPQRYAEFDPNKCLSFVYPDGMRDGLQKAIEAHLASLPAFDASGQRLNGSAPRQER